MRNVGKLKYGKALYATPKCVPICVSGILVAQGWADFDNFQKKIQNMTGAKIYPSAVECFTCTTHAPGPGGLRQSPRNFRAQPAKRKHMYHDRLDIIQPVPLDTCTMTDSLFKLYNKCLHIHLRMTGYAQNSYS